MIPEAFLGIFTLASIGTAVVSGVALALVIRTLRPLAHAGLIAYLASVIGIVWYVPQATQLLILGDGGWGSIGRLVLYLTCFVAPMWWTLRTTGYHL